MPALDKQPAARAHLMSDLASDTTPHSIGTVQHDARGLSIDWSDGRRTHFHVLWLRDNCACRQCRHPQALERTYIFLDHAAPVLMSAMIDTHNDLEVQFQQGPERHLSRFTRGWLRAQDPAETLARSQALRPQLWETDIASRLTRVDYTGYLQTQAGVRAWISALKTQGIVLLQGVPRVPGKLLEVASHIGPVRASNFGEYYDVVSMPDPNASAYTPMGLELHTDLANWRWPPDIQLLFCLTSSVKGGESVFADGFRIADDLRQSDPAAFSLLATQPVEYRFHDDRCDIRTKAPVIELDSTGAVKRIRFNNWLRGATSFAGDVIEPMYAALGKFWRLLRARTCQLHLRLEPGELIAFDNNRVLHGRAPFDASHGERHLQGCYLNEEDLDSTLRLLERPAS